STSPRSAPDPRGHPPPPAALARLGSQRLVHGPGLSFVAFARDDRSFHSVGSTSVRHWDVSNGKELGAFEFSPDEQILGTAVSPDARFLACSTADGHVSIRDLNTGKTLHRFATKGLCSNLAFGPEGRTIAWSDSTGAIHVTELSGDRKTRDFKGMQQPIKFLTLSADGKLLAALLEGQDRAVIWDAVSGKRLRQYIAGDGRRGQQAITSIALDPEGKLLYGVTSEGVVVAWETDSLEERYQ